MVQDEMEKLTIINGVEVTEDDEMKIQVAFDGETVTFRHEDGTIQSMGILCYLHFVLVHFIETLTDDGIMPPDGVITPGHVLSHVIDHLHEQHHELSVGNKLAAFSNMMGGLVPDDKEMVVMKMGENGLEEIPISELPNEIAKIKAGEDVEISDSDSDEDEIIVHGTKNDPKQFH